VRAQGRGEIGAGLDELRKRTQPRACHLQGLAAAGADDVHEAGEPVARVGARRREGLVAQRVQAGDEGCLACAGATRGLQTRWIGG